MERIQIMNKIIKVRLQKYLATFCITAAHVMIIALVVHLFLPEIQIIPIIVLGIGFYLFKMINYLVVSIEVKEQSIVYNGFIKRGIMIPLKAIKEIELEGPSQFNSNYMLAFFKERKSLYDRNTELGRLPIYWFSRMEVLQLLESIKKVNPTIKYQKKINQYLIGVFWKYLLVNYIIQYTILIGIMVFIITKYS
jgi:hypothetical protein